MNKSTYVIFLIRIKFTCFLLVALILFSCSTSESFVEDAASYREISLDELPELKILLKNVQSTIKLSNNWAERDEALRESSLQTNKIIQITKYDKSTFTFGLYTNFRKSRYIANLHLHETNEGHVAYIISYFVPEGWYGEGFATTPEGDPVLNPAEFKGTRTKYSLDGQVIWSTEHREGLRSEPVEICMRNTVTFCRDKAYGDNRAVPHIKGTSCKGPFYNVPLQNCFNVFMNNSIDPEFRDYSTRKE